jgi:hypothetical protein
VWRGLLGALDSSARTPFPVDMQSAAALASETAGARVAKMAEMAFAAIAVVLVAPASRPVLAVPEATFSPLVIPALAMAV